MLIILITALLALSESTKIIPGLCGSAHHPTDVKKLTLEECYTLIEIGETSFGLADIVNANLIYYRSKPKHTPQWAFEQSNYGISTLEFEIDDVVGVFEVNNRMFCCENDSEWNFTLQIHPSGSLIAVWAEPKPEVDRADFPPWVWIFLRASDWLHNYTSATELLYQEAAAEFVEKQARNLVTVARTYGYPDRVMPIPRQSTAIPVKLWPSIGFGFGIIIAVIVTFCICW